jgi:hypothetical protein
MTAETIQVGFRMAKELVDRIDEYAEYMDKQNPGMKMSRADAVRILVTRALDETDKERKSKRKS